MEKTKDKLIIGLLFLVIVVSGCTANGDDSASSTTALQINEFSVFPNPAPGDQRVTLRMEVENVGGADASEVHARLWNPPFGNDSGVWRNPSGDSEPTLGERTVNFRDIDAAGDQTPSVPQTSSLDFTTPALSQGRNIDYTWHTYLMYGYQTVADTEISLISADRQQQQGGSSGESATLDNSDAPIQMEIRTPTPITFYEDDIEGGDLTRDLCIIARNQGTGTPFIYESQPDGDTGYDLEEVNDNLGKLEIDIEDVGNYEFDSDTEGPSEFAGNQAVECFEMTIGGVSSSTVQETVPLRVTADYSYREEHTTGVTVEGR